MAAPRTGVNRADRDMRLGSGSGRQRAPRRARGLRRLGSGPSAKLNAADRRRPPPGMQGEGARRRQARAASATVDAMLLVTPSSCQGRGDLVPLAITNRDGVPHDLVLVSTGRYWALRPSCAPFRTNTYGVDGRNPHRQLTGGTPPPRRSGLRSSARDDQRLFTSAVASAS